MHWCVRGIVCSAMFLVAGAFMGIDSSAQDGVPVVPGAAGFGMSTRAAYGCGTDPDVIRVTNLNDSGRGSLRDAIMATRPRVIIFETSGTIDLSVDIDVLSPCLTIAGQTAPSPGITLRNGGINVWARDVLVQHLRIRPGDGGPVLPQTVAHNGLLVYEQYGYRPYNVVFDHVSVSWSGGKNISLSASGATTVWQSIISEALYYANNVIVTPGQPSSLGVLIDGYDSHVSIVGSLFAHNADRNPEIHEASTVHFVNNVVYDWGKDQHNYTWATLFYSPVPGPWAANIVGNMYIAGPGPHPYLPLRAIGTWSGQAGSQLYLDDNAVDGTRQAVQVYENYMPFTPRVSDPPVPWAGITAMPSSSVESFVLAAAGARPADRDAVDSRIVHEVATRTGDVISSQNEVGGWPELAVNHRPLAVPQDPHTQTASGYTNLEAWLHEHAWAVEGAAPVEAAQAPKPPKRVRVDQSGSE